MFSLLTQELTEQFLIKGIWDCVLIVLSANQERKKQKLRKIRIHQRLYLFSWFFSKKFYLPISSCFFKYFSRKYYKEIKYTTYSAGGTSKFNCSRATDVFVLVDGVALLTASFNSCFFLTFSFSVPFLRGHCGQHSHQ